MVHWCMINSVVMWVHILVGRGCYVYVALFGSTELITHQCTIINYFNKV